MKKENISKAYKFPNIRQGDENNSQILIKKKGNAKVAILLLVIVFLIWEFWGRTALLYDSAIVFVDDLPKGTIVTEEMLAVVKVEDLSSKAIMQEDVEKLVGKESIQYIPKGTVIYNDYFVERELTPMETSDLKIVAVPMSWLDSYPETLRRGDTVEFYNIGENENKGPVVSAKVAHVKDSENIEVEDSGGDRTVGTASVKTIEVLLNNEQLIILTSMVDYGTKFMLSYQQ